jgi:hypothetical protein
MWALLLLLFVIAAVHLFEYHRSIQEYTIAQPATLDRHDQLRSLLYEKTPIPVEIGSLPWRPEVVSKSAWSVTVGSEGSEVFMSASQWLAEKERPALLNGSELAEEMEFETGLADLNESRAWWWLPGLRDVTVGILEKGAVLDSGLSWISAERQWIGCSHGGPLTVWLVHSRYRRYLPTEVENPWSLTVGEAPWIGRVQYIEVIVKPGWCLGLPAHWGYAVRADEEAWWWRSNQVSAASLGLEMFNELL